MGYETLAYAHLATVLPAWVLGSWLLLRRKGSPMHKTLGKVWMLLMLFTALSTLWMPARVGPVWLGHFGFLHLLSLLVFFNIGMAWWAIRHGNVRRHQRYLTGLYIGGLLIAGAFAFMPGRLLHSWLFG